MTATSSSDLKRMQVGDKEEEEEDEQTSRGSPVIGKCWFWHLNSQLGVVHILRNHGSQVEGAWTERQKMFHGGSFLKLADENKYIKNPEAQNRGLRGF